MASQDLWLVEQAGEAVAVFLLQNEDPVFWDDYPGGEALFLHRIAVARTMAGGLATRAMMNAVLVEAAVRGRAFIRLDCAPLSKLCGAYERLGFRRVDRCIKDGYDVYRFELSSGFGGETLRP